MDQDAEFILNIYRHIHPDFSSSHAQIYRFLWRLEPSAPGKIIEETRISRGTTFKVLRELISFGLVKKTEFEPVGYYAPNPVQAFSNHAKIISTKLVRARQKIFRIVNNSPANGGEVFFVKKDGQRLISKSRKRIDEKGLLEIRKAIDLQLTELKCSRVRQFAIYR